MVKGVPHRLWTVPRHLVRGGPAPGAAATGGPSRTASGGRLHRCAARSPRSTRRRRTAAVFASSTISPPPARPPAPRPSLVPLRNATGALGAGAMCAVLLGGAAGCLLGAALAAGIWRWLRKHTTTPSAAAEALREEAASRRLPLAADLLAACLAAGSGPGEASRSVGEAIGGPLGERMVRVADELRLGADPSEAWDRLGALPGTATLARCLRRSHASGVPATEITARLAAELRADRTREAAARARRAGVVVTAPLGLCFLPAFLLAGVVPVAVGLGRTLL